MKSNEATQDIFYTTSIYSITYVQQRWEVVKYKYFSRNLYKLEGQRPPAEAKGECFVVYIYNFFFKNFRQTFFTLSLHIYLHYVQNFKVKISLIQKESFFDLVESKTIYVPGLIHFSVLYSV